MQRVYTGGPVDYAALDRTHVWRHVLALRDPAWDWYCPICANQDKPDDATIMDRNMDALLSSARAIFKLDGLFTVGTPVEIYVKMQQAPTSVCIVHQAGMPGVFVRWWEQMGAAVVFHESEAIEWLARSRV